MKLPYLYRALLILTLSTFWVQESHAQNKAVKGTCIGLMGTTNGIGLSARTSFPGKIEDLSHSVRLSFQTLNNPNETRVQNASYTNPKPYVFDKINQGGTFRLGYGFRKRLSESVPEKPVLTLVIGTGANIGFLKPYYVRFENPDDTKNNILVVRQNELTKTFRENITGPANWTVGLNEITTQFGLHTSVSLDLEWFHSYNFKSWETGVQLDYFFDEFTIMNERNLQAFVGIFTSYSFGKK